MSRSDRILLGAIIGVTLLALGAIGWGAVWLRAEFQQQDQQEIHHALRHLCQENTSFC